MSQDLKQATTVTVPIGPFVTSDGTAVEGLNLSTGDILLSFNGGAYAAKSDATTAAHSSVGWYMCQVGIVDTSALGRLDFAIDKTGTLPVWRHDAVVTSNYWDTKYGADYFDVNLVADQSGATIGVVQALTSVSSVGVASVVHSLTTVGTVQSLSHVAAVGIASVVHALTTVGVAQTVNDFSATATANIAIAVWNRILTGATHNVATSAGRRLRQVEAISVMESGTLASATSANVEFPGTSNGTNDFYNHQLLIIIANTGIGQARTLDNYVGASKVANVHPDWVTTPDSTSDYLLLGFGEVHVHELQASATTQVYDQAVSALTAYHPVSVVSSVAVTSVVNSLSAVVGVAQASAIAAIGPAKNIEMPDFPFFMVSDSDHITPLTSVSPIGLIKKDSGAFASLSNAVAEISSYGMYVVTVTSTEMNADKISLVFNAAGADQVGIIFITT